MIKATKSVLIVRISDKGQDDGMSPEQQIELGENYSKSHKLIPIKTFSFIESSYKGEREQFYIALKFVKEQIEPIAIVIKCVDRLQRRFDETKELENLIERGKIELHFISEGLIINQNSPASDYTRWDLGVIFGRNSSKTTSEKVKNQLNIGENMVYP